MDTLRALLTGIVDYAGLFPPAKLPMGAAVREYARWRGAESSWMLGAFVVPAGRLEEFEAEATTLLPADGSGEAWPLSVLLGPDGRADVETAAAFAARHEVGAGRGRAEIVAVELRPADPETIALVAEALPAGVELFCELDPVSEELDAWLTVVASVRARAKIRTGGIEASAFPPPEGVARFLLACARAGVGLKFTAGLHHPLRSEHALTYEDDAPRGTMHGFLNVFTAAALAARGDADMATLVAVLEEREADAFTIDGDAWCWRDECIDARTLAVVRTRFARSFGSCSFAEPVRDLQHLKML